MLKREKRKIQQHCIFSKIPKQYYYPSLKCACLNSQYTQINHKITKNQKKNPTKQPRTKQDVIVMEFV